MKNWYDCENRLVGKIDSPKGRNDNLRRNTEDELQQLKNSIGANSEKNNSRRGSRSVLPEKRRRSGQSRLSERNSTRRQEGRNGRNSIEAKAGRRRRVENTTSTEKMSERVVDTRTPEEIISEIEQPRIDGKYFIFSSEEAFEKYLDWWKKNFETDATQVDLLEKYMKRSRRLETVKEKEQEVGGYVIERMAPSKQALDRFTLLTADKEMLQSTIADTEKRIQELEFTMEFEGETINSRDPILIRIESCNGHISRMSPEAQQKIVSRLTELGYDEYVRSDDLYTLYDDTNKYSSEQWKEFVRIADDADGQLSSVEWKEGTQFFQENISELTYCYSQNQNMLWDLIDVVKQDANNAEIRQTNAQREYEDLQEKRDMYHARLEVLK